MANERSGLIADARLGVGAYGVPRGTKPRRGRLYGPFADADVAGEVRGGVGHGRASASTRARSSGRHAWLCAAPLALLALALGVRVLASVAPEEIERVRGVGGWWPPWWRRASHARERGRESGVNATTPEATFANGTRANQTTSSLPPLASPAPAPVGTSSPWGTWAGTETIEHANMPKFESGQSLGVALNGWLHLEEWFFSQGASHAVAADIREENGVAFPPMFPDATSLGFQWASEGDLVRKLVDHYGQKSAVGAFTAHRAQYITDDDLIEIASQGIKIVRLPVSWAVFARDPATVARGGERVLVDPVYPDRLFVNMAGADLDHIVERIRNAGLKVMIDLHNMPGGSAAGSYNGVFPHPPMMFARSDLQRTGLLVVRNMLKWFKALPADSRLAVHGMQLLNEPGHLLPEQRSAVLSWLSSAIQAYKDDVVGVNGVNPAERVPFLYVNLIETMGMNVADMAAWMRTQFTPRELEQWAVLDVHNYFAWSSLTGCDGGCQFSCRDSPAVVGQRVAEHAEEWAKTFRLAAKTYGVQNTACSEWSLATLADSSRMCSNREILDVMFQRQVQVYRSAEIQSFFWGWKMPHGGPHTKAWSLKDYLSSSTGKQDEPEHELVPHGVALESTLAMPEGSSKEDRDRLIRAYSNFPEKEDELEDGPDTVKLRMKDILHLIQEAAHNTGVAAIGHGGSRTAKTGAAEAAAEDYLRASSKLKEIVDTGAYDEDDDAEIVVVHHRKGQPEVIDHDNEHKEEIPTERNVVPAPTASVAPNISSTPPRENATSAVGAKDEAEKPSTKSGSIESLFDESKTQPPSPPPPMPPPPPNPPKPPSKEVLEAHKKAADTLSELDFSSNTANIDEQMLSSM